MSNMRGVVVANNWNCFCFVLLVIMNCEAAREGFLLLTYYLGIIIGRADLDS